MGGGGVYDRGTRILGDSFIILRDGGGLVEKISCGDGKWLDVIHSEDIANKIG